MGKKKVEVEPLPFTAEDCFDRMDLPFDQYTTLLDPFGLASFTDRTGRVWWVSVSRVD